MSSNFKTDPSSKDRNALLLIALSDGKFSLHLLPLGFALRCPCECVWLFATPWTIAHQAPLSMEFSRQEYCSGLPFPPPGYLPNPEIEPGSLCLLHWQMCSIPSVPPAKPWGIPKCGKFLFHRWTLTNVNPGAPGFFLPAKHPLLPKSLIVQFFWIPDEIPASPSGPGPGGLT